jgi:TolB protein
MRSRWSPARVILIAIVVFAAAAVVWIASQSRRTDRIVFVAEENGAWDLWWMRGDGTGAARLTETPLDERAPALSPDQTRIAYSTSDGGLSILDTSNRTATRIPVADGRHSNPSWSPDGRQLVFTTYTMSAQGEDATLWIYDVDQQGTPRQLILQDGAQDFARIHPDGRSLVYSSSGAITVFGFGYQVVQQLWTLSLVTGRVEELILARGSKDTQPAWSPDGRSLAFVSDREGATRLWRADADGNGLKRLTKDAEASSNPAWSPTGAEIVFVTTDGRRSRLAVVPAEGGAVRPLELSGRISGNVRDPHWR